MNTKLMAAIVALLLVAPFSYAGGNRDKDTPSVPTLFFTGDGGKGIRLAVLEPTGTGLSTQEQWVLSQVQGSITADFHRFSAITIIDRQNLEKILAEQTQSLSGNYSEQDYVRLGNLTNARLILAGTIRKTANNYMLELAVTDAESGERRASYPPKAVSLIALENNAAAKEATAELLKQLGVNLTAAALQELKTVENNTAKIQAENALARGIAAQRQGTEVAALSYFFQAAALDPTLAEAENRSSILAANISSGNIGEDARNEIVWRRNWIARLAETEQYFNNYFDNFFKTGSTPFVLMYTTEIKQEEIDFQNETVTLSIETSLRASPEWQKSIESVLRSMQSSIKAVQDGLAATRRAAAWGLGNWPEQHGFNLEPFGRQNKNFTVIFELVNSRNQVIGRQTIQTAGSYEIPAPMPGAKTTISVYEDDIKTVTFVGVKADDITDNLTIRIASINGVNAETVAKNGVLQISTVQSSYFSMLSLAERKKQEAAAAEERKRQEAAVAAERKRQEAAAAEERKKQEAAAAEERKKQEAAAAEERKKRETIERKVRWEEYREDYLVFPVFLELGYVYQSDYPLGFRLGLLGFYTTWNIHFTDWGEYGFAPSSTSNTPYFDKEGKIILKNDSEKTTNYTYLDKQTETYFEWIVGFSINVINDRLMVPIGIGLKHSLDYRLFRYKSTDSLGRSSDETLWVPAGVLKKGRWETDWQNDLLFEIGLSFNPIKWISLFATYRSIGWQENSFTLGACLIAPMSAFE